MLLRKFLPSDRADFLAMCQDFYSGGAVLEPIPTARMEETFHQIISGCPYAAGYILEEEGCTAGYGLVWPFYSNEAGGLCLMLDEIYVKPAFRGKGLGRQYLDTVAAAFGPQVKGLRLEICPENEGARRLYERAGFRPLGYQSMIRAL